MKKLFTLLFVVCGLMSAKAQLPDGSIAPDWTMSDINGTSHTLYNYLDSGYSVFLDFSATWCGPCWSYHTSHAFRDLHNQYGPGTADDRVRVFMIEGDASTSNADLLGQTSASWGNWTTGVPYPIIDDAAITGSYQIGFWPTIYKVCPNRVITVVGQGSTAALWAEAQMGDCQPATQAVDVLLQSYDGDLGACDPSTPVNMEVTIMNFGVNTLTSATINVLDGSTVVATQQYTGSLATYGAASVNLGGVAVSATTNYTFEVIVAGDGNTANNSVDQTISVAAVTTMDTLDLLIQTDAFGYETYWAVVDDQNIIWAQGGNTNVGLYGGGAQNASAADPGAYGANATINETVIVPFDGCYKFVVVDDYADGICCQYGNGSYLLSDANFMTLATGGDFDASDESPFKAETATSVENVAALNNLNLFPNPATVNLTVEFTLAASQDMNISIMNALGQVVRVVNTGSMSAGQHNLNVNTSDFSTGMYFMSFSNGSQVTTKRFIVAE